MKLYRKEEKNTVTVKANPFDGAEEIEVMEYSEAVKTLSDFYKSQGDTLMDEYACSGVLFKWLQNGENYGLGNGSEYDETIFRLSSDDLRRNNTSDEDIAYQAFGGRTPYEYDKITIDEDGEIEFDDDSPTYLRFA